MRLLPLPLTDDLGRRVPVAVVTKDLLRFVDADWKRRRALPGLKREMNRGALWLLALIVVSMFAAQLLAFAWNPLPTLGREWSFVILVCALAVALAPVRAWLVGIVRPLRPEQTRQRFLAALLCPACAHDLDGVPPREGGVTVCPECGAVWRMEGTEARSHEGMKGSGG